ncbi:MAG: GntR family transcriptional regulator [Pseudoruegeria sp.]
MTDTASKPKSNTQRAIDAMREMIFSGELTAGSDHLESELAQRLDMSRTPVREAALTLESQGLLEMRPRKGVRILSVSSGDMREIYDVLTELESLAVRRAASFGYSNADLVHLANAMKEMEATIEAGELEDWADADGKFHTELVRLGKNKRLEAIAGIMSDQVRRARTITLFMRPVPTQSNQDHRLVYEAIQSGQSDHASALHRAHMERARDVILALLERHRLKRV